MKKTCLLQLLVYHFPAISKKKLHAMVLCGEVKVNGETVKDPHRVFPHHASLMIDQKKRYVSRGGDKLEKALEVFAINCDGRIFMDCGASTGGFTDCLLAHGAEHVYAVDVGYSQFDYSLRHHPRVSLFERTNVSSLSNDDFPRLPDAAVIDLSFRSLSGIACHILNMVREGWAIALVKPQFEWENPPPDFHGVVRHAEQRRHILLACADKLMKEHISVKQACCSPIKGAKGNQEYFFLITAADSPEHTSPASVISSLFL